ncbi:MAG TPA: urate hydroxylase PuuD [Gemmatimonadales bacterium]|nr:urate hydroxylase PuuD [Gemmatimonadales bacterium]
MSGTSLELVDLVARWVHLIAGIMWIGNSLLFNWLDRNLLPAGSHPQTPRPIGTIWLLHSGGFYYVEKTLLEGAAVPAPLHWFKWQAYSTWWSGLLLLLVVYYFGGRALLADPSVASLSHAQAVLVGAGAILAGWALYEAMQRFVAPRAPGVAAAVWIGGLTVLAIALTQLLNGRAAFLHVGAMLGTLMAANVVLTIVPSQRALVASVEQGHGGGAELSARAKRVSIHNNYFTFPVIVLMLSGHFPTLSSQPHNWLALLVLIGGGAAVRHVLNIRFGFPVWRPALFAAMGATVAALYTIGRSGSTSPAGRSSDAGTPVSFADARHVIDRRCGSCHSVRQSDTSFGPAPGGVTFDTPEEIVARAARIGERAVLTRTMPPGNKTGITDGERALLGRWIASR